MSKKGNSDKGNNEAKETGTAVAMTGSNSVAAKLAAMGIQGATVAKLVTLPVLKLETGKPRLLRINSPIEKSRYVDPKAGVDEATGEKKRASICDVADLQTGELGRLVVATVIEKNLQEGYEGDAYVGRCFLIEKGLKRPDKRYIEYSIVEVNVPSSVTPVAA